MDDSEPITARETGATDRGLVMAHLAREHAIALVDAAARAAFADGLDMRRLARQSRSMAERFDAWTRGEATIEHRVEDLAAWRDVLAASRELGVG